MTSRRADVLAWSAVASAAVAFVACLAGWLAGGGSVEVAWAPTLDLRLELAFDGLAALYALLATGIGVLVFVYGAGYLPWHLEHLRRPSGDAWRFWPWMVFFMGSMVGLACARDLVLLFVFFDLTAVASYFLIGFDRDRDARGAALMALLVTGVSAVAMLVGAVLLYNAYGGAPCNGHGARRARGRASRARAAPRDGRSLRRSADAGHLRPAPRRGSRHRPGRARDPPRLAHHAERRHRHQRSGALRVRPDHRPARGPCHREGRVAASGAG